MSPSLTYFHTDTTNELQRSQNTPPTRTRSTIPIPSSQLLPLGRHVAPASTLNFPSLSSLTSLQPVKMALRTSQGQNNSSDHTPKPHSRNTSVKKVSPRNFRSTQHQILQELQMTFKNKARRNLCSQLCPNNPNHHAPSHPKTS